ncbi:GNAT family N-acetyltransferase [Erwinia tracheiphila]|uniref:GNAT family N-acetyltransferase n=1 Tax=Erwinia tracheiphila TaxID=65700 RepID=A0A345CY05_9GAMM|nr:GNAT family N-acetyltransferase [Erwinia tracheiphila]AXF78322.1 GNAT family N-acetyltransferase [Erwinia tracheiphila]UIA82947.1 GNAT family N-acetyltransferase [Erwinia tracheiphila]UIA91526.1 GNAT family N-acetyltransferase [Erwinia tracheiphila]
MTSTASMEVQIRPIQPADNPFIARVIRDVSSEFGLSADKGFTVADPNLDRLFELYSEPDSAYWVIELDGVIVGGGGVAPLLGSDADICELQKMYFMPIVRGMGIAKKLALKAMDFARSHGYQRCYLETTASLTRAIRLYEHLGFEHIDGPMGCTGHTDCEVTMLCRL